MAPAQWPRRTARSDPGGLFYCRLSAPRDPSFRPLRRAIPCALRFFHALAPNIFLFDEDEPIELFRRSREIVGEKSLEIHYRLFLLQLLPFSIIHTELGLDFYGRMELSYLYQPLSSHDARLNSDYPLRVRDLSNCAQ